MGADNKKIAKNTMMLYFRMLLTMIVSLFTVRIVLGTLGKVDYGLYNVVGGLVTMFSFLSSTMTNMSQRYFSFELGKGNLQQLKKTFSTTLIIYVFLALLILLLAETIGLWFLNNKMTIPTDRLYAANWVFQFSLLTFMTTMFTIPYNALIIAHEKMSVYAYVSIIEVVLKLVLVLLLVYMPFDKLILYGVLMFVVMTTVTLIYRIYCLRNFEESKFSYLWDKGLFKEILSYSGWNLFGSLTKVGNVQGQAIILNLFFGPTVNAAKAISDRINSIVVLFSNNFYTAIRPQIIKNYASGNLRNMFNLVYSSTKFSFYLLYVLTIPLILHIEFILGLWLGKENVYFEMVMFGRLVLIYSLVNVFEQPITVMIQATGKIRNYQIVIGVLTLLFVPICYVMLKAGYPSYYSMVLLIVIYSIAQFIRVYIAKRQVNLSIKLYIMKVFVPILCVVLPTILISVYFYQFLNGTFVKVIASIIIFELLCIVCVYSIGIRKNERLMLNNFVKNNVLSKLRKNR